MLLLCRINSDEEKQPLTASVHPAFLSHCMKIDGFDIISKASLSHTPAVEGAGSTGPFHSNNRTDGRGCYSPQHALYYFARLSIFSTKVSFRKKKKYMPSVPCAGDAYVKALNCDAPAKNSGHLSSSKRNQEKEANKGMEGGKKTYSFKNE